MPKVLRSGRGQVHLSSTGSAPLEIIDQLVEAFRHEEGFGPSALTIGVSPRSTIEGRVERKEVTRSFHYSREGSFSLVLVHGSPRSAWVRDTSRNLSQAGYAAGWKLENESGYRRWLVGHRQVTAELKFLRSLGEQGSPKNWPHRAVTSQPARLRRLTPQAWSNATDAVRAAGIPWNSCAPCVSRRAELDLTAFMLDASAVAFSDLRDGLSLNVCVRIFDPAFAAPKVPPAIARYANSELLRAGYQKRLVKGQIFATKRVKSATVAARECSRIFARLQERTREARL